MADAQVFLHVGFGQRPAVQARVQVDKDQILALLGREGFPPSVHRSPLRVPTLRTRRPPLPERLILIEPDRLGRGVWAVGDCAADRHWGEPDAVV
jgi:hypothetical protein